MAMDFRETHLSFDTPAHVHSERIGRVRFDRNVIRATCTIGDLTFGFKNGDHKFEILSYRLDEMRIDGREVSFRYVFQLADKRGLDDPISGRLRVVVLAEVEDA